MTRRIIRTVDGQIFSDSRGRFQDRRGEILYKRGLFNTVRINKRSITSDDVRGTPAALVFVVLLVIAVAVLLLLSAISMASYDLSDGDLQRNPNITSIAATRTVAEAKPKATVEAKSEVIVDAKSGTYYLLGCSRLEQVNQHDKRIFEERQAKSFGYKKHEACSK